MAFLKFSGISISGIAAAVPSKIIENKDYTHFLSEKEVSMVIKMTGIEKRRFADDKTCASDLSYSAAQTLLTEMDVNLEEIDMLIFVSQTPDFRTPPTSMIIQERLGLPKSTGCFDINLGCSGFIYGVATAFTYANMPTIRKVLLLNGETKSKAYSAKDKATSLLFGDGGTATLIEKKGDHDTFITLNSNGAGSKFIKMPGGGYRNPSSIETLKEKVYEDGSIRTDEQGSMDGEAIFNFTITDVPRDMKNMLKTSETNLDDIDYIIPHQANKFITDHIAKKLKVDKSKMVYAIQKFGNTSGVSIPLTIVSELQNELNYNCKQLMMTGFGVGLSWGSIITTFDKCYISNIKEV